MSISIKRYVDIQSGVGAGSSVAQRDLIGRLFTNSPLVPANAVVEFDTADDVARYFGASTPEHNRAVFYFAFVSKSIASPRKLGFARWAKIPSKAAIFGGKPIGSVAAFAAIASGNMTLKVGGETAALLAVDLSAVVSYADVATALTSAFQLIASPQFITATVEFFPTWGTFLFASSEAEAADIAVTDPGNLAALLGWTTAQGAVFSPGVDLTPIAEALGASVDVSNNFGSFAFVEDLTVTEVGEASAWNAARNLEFMYLARAESLDVAQNLVGDNAGNAGTGITFAPDPMQYDELLPMAIFAATNYDLRNSSQNYMFQRADLTPKVASNSDADSFDRIRVNYYGNTQTAGQQINFYQRGILLGTDTAPTDMNTYANEVWLKDAAQSAVMALLLAVPRIPANQDGRGQVMAILQDPINRALNNGVISIGKSLSVQQKVFVTQVTGDPLAWHQVQTIGYWLDAKVEAFTGEGGTQEFKIVYVLVYSKDDAVRKVEGTHILI